MTSTEFYRHPEFATIQLHGGQKPDPTTNARAVPIYASTSFCFESSAHGADIFQLNSSSFSYSRVRNPTVDVFEKRMSELEGGVAAVATSSGQSARFLAISALAGTGDNIISVSHLQADTYTQFKVTFKKFGINIKFVQGTNVEEFESAIDERTKAIYIETVNPKLEVSDIPALAKVAHEHGIPLVVDNTFGMGGYLIRPIEHGADIVVHSTEYISGADVPGGIIIDSGNFPWDTSPRFSTFTTPNEPYHGVIFSHKFGRNAYAAKLRAELGRDVGPCMNPFGAFLVLIGVETLSLRAERISQNAKLLAGWLERNPNVTSISYPGLLCHSSHETAKVLFRPGYFGGLVNFRVVDNLRLTSKSGSGGSRTHMTSGSREKLLTTSDDLVTVSAGIENISDIIADFEGAFKTVFEE
ncbi:O-acetylhomoserine ami [Cyathus striatus]|nr:O-acetylhomoserine ami [Cyathus striatus]